MQPARRISHQELLVDQYTIFAERLVNKIVRTNNLPYNLEEDLKAAARLGLVEAANKFSSDYGVSFSNYAYYRIRGSIYDCLRLSGNLPNRIYQRLQVLEAQNEFTYASKSKASVSSRSDLNDRLADVLEVISNNLIIEKLGKLIDKTPQAITNDYQEENRVEEIREELKDIIKTLPAKEKFIIENYYFNQLSFTEIAEVMGNSSKSWISRLHTRGIEMIKIAWQERNYQENSVLSKIQEK